ncbi:hypothetical protein [Streptomyces sp. NRRL S-244]|uniref:hypothetical protein n=1 Tax=Streptomyces sp. NRRL S-244 TaxID=1463897 RepID=UPI000AF719D0|nr:hypothetical protein [Streptomyces sp. NRRL S-244]
MSVVAPAAWQVWSYASSQSESGTLSGGSGERPVSAVEIDAGGADVRLTPRSDGQVVYRAEVRWSVEAPKIEESWLGDTLKLTPRCPAAGDLLASGIGCSVDLGVTVPAGVPVKVTAGSGTVVVSGLGGAVDAEVGAGTLRLSALRGPLRASVGSGSLEASGLSSPQAEIRAGTGSAVARFAAPPERLTARAGAGRLRLTVPADTRFRVTAHAGAGRCDVAPGMDDPAATGRLDISADAGRAEAGY